jgi:hypothetical protein
MDLENVREDLVASSEILNSRNVDRQNGSRNRKNGSNGEVTGRKKRRTGIIAVGEELRRDFLI